MGRTITVDDDVAERLEAEAVRSGRTVDEVLREKLEPVADVARKPFRVRAKNMGPLLIDVTSTGRALAILDELEEK